jgi:ABC-type proline/glycine betaine transport system permease subunit
MLATLLQYQLINRFSRCAWAVLRTATALIQTIETFGVITLQILVTSLSTDPKILAKIAYSEATRLS